MQLAFNVPGQALLHYRLLEQIGAGGMGVVYRAHDEQLDRDVALKILPLGTLTDDTSRKRFRKEAIALAKLNHPNIAAVYEFNTQDGVDFIAMELVCGVTLSKLCESSILSKHLLGVAKQIALAIEEAHDHGIVHGDLKPSNVMETTKNQIKVLDFGLARPFRVSDTAQTESLSEIRGAVGTLSYMAPEVLRGRSADNRSDIWSLGVLLYEMCTRRLPFTGKTTFEVSSAILKESPARIPKTVPPRFRSFLLKCLQKEPSLRYQNAREVVQALESIQPEASVLGRDVKGRRGVLGFALLAICIVALLVTTSVRWRLGHWLFTRTAPQERQLAVLALPVSANEPEIAAFSNGLTETLAARLIQLSGNHPLQVIPASEVRAKGVTTLREAQQEFGVNMGLEIQLRRSGEMVRVNYSLVDAQTHRQLGGDTITARATDVFAVEDKVADSVVKSLQIELRPEERRLLTVHGTTEPAAYDYYLQGRGYLQEFQKQENVESAITVFSHALEKDPNFSLAYAGLGEAYWRRYELEKQNQWAKQAREACEKAASLDADQAESHLCLGLVFNGTGHYQQAVTQFQRAVQSDSTNDDAIRGLASGYAKMGRLDEAEKAYQVATEARPHYWRNYNSLGALYISEGHYLEATKMFSRVIDLAPDSFRGYSNLGGAYVLLGQYSAAITALNRSVEIRPTVDALSNLATAYFHLRRFDDAARNYEEATKLNGQDYVVWGNLADAYHYSGKRQTESVAAYRKAIALAKLKLEINPNDPAVLGDLASYSSMLGNRADAIMYIDRALQLEQRDDPDVLFSAVMVHNQFGETNAALQLLSRALDAGFSPSTVADAPALDNLHSNPAFQQLLRRKTNR
jgi:serine/threonine-protein kinase